MVQNSACFCLGRGCTELSMAGGEGVDARRYPPQGGPGIAMATACGGAVMLRCTGVGCAWRPQGPGVEGDGLAPWRGLGGTRARVCACLCVCAWGCVCLSACAQVCECMDACVHVCGRVHAWMCVCMLVHVCVCICKYMCACVRARGHVCARLHAYVCVCTPVHVPMCTYAHTKLCMLAHLLTQNCVCSCTVVPEPPYTCAPTLVHALLGVRCASAHICGEGRACRSRAALPLAMGCSSTCAYVKRDSRYSFRQQQGKAANTAGVAPGIREGRIHTRLFHTLPFLHFLS